MSNQDGYNDLLSEHLMFHGDSLYSVQKILFLLHSTKFYSFFRVTWGLSNKFSVTLTVLFTINNIVLYLCASQMALMMKNLPANAGSIRDKRCWLHPWVRKIPWGEHGNPLQYSFLENPMNSGVWQAIVQGPKQLDTTEGTQHTCTHTLYSYLYYYYLLL